MAQSFKNLVTSRTVIFIPAHDDPNSVRRSVHHAPGTSSMIDLDLITATSKFGGFSHKAQHSKRDVFHFLFHSFKRVLKKEVERPCCGSCV